MRGFVRGSAAAILGGLAVLATPTLGAFAQDSALPEAPEKNIVVDACSTCHGMEQTVGQTRSADEWAEVVDRMASYGAPAVTENREKILAYLNTHFGKGAPVPAPTAPPESGQAGAAPAQAPAAGAAPAEAPATEPAPAHNH